MIYFFGGGAEGAFPTLDDVPFWTDTNGDAPFFQIIFTAHFFMAFFTSHFFVAFFDEKGELPVFDEKVKLPKASLGHASPLRPLFLFAIFFLS